ncbi:methionyl-tRNA formyltransferase [Flavobacterium sp.]|uniref:methionyl-tRNA formyltransferase n=1 Tax=Flavobacterium sp. TaxID=239 RepID=UPI002604D198|nr:methionyl-tRNA formyltransferase [Flavobacterium sp.]MDD3004056.1 methionyl-tRNA formyltransferase [Flavobacterium sp.]
MKKLRIVFMGTPDFAVGILDSIIKHNYEVVGVITAADKPAGRGQKIKYSAVKEYALAHNLHLLQPTNLKDDNFISELKNLNANLQVVVAFRMLPKVVWEMPELGTFNLHASLLPEYRGAAPINWAIINGDTKTGVTTFFIDDKIDTGAIILNKETEISFSENAGSLHDRLMVLGAEATIETLKQVENKTVKTTLQNDAVQLKTAHKLNKDNCKINWTNNGISIYNLIRGLSPYPAAWFMLYDQEKEYNIKVYDAVWNEATHSYATGTFLSDKNSIKVAVKDGFIELLELQMPGKKKMKAKDILNGTHFSEHAIAR